VMVKGVRRLIRIVRETGKSQVSEAAVVLPSDFSPPGCKLLLHAICYLTF